FATLEEHDLLARVRRPFEDAWPRISWDRACAMRSGFEALRDIFERHAPALVAQTDMSRVEQRMIQHGETLFVPQQIPDGTPSHHWWWRSAVPPREREMHMNERMRDLLPPRGLHADNAPPKFRALVGHGFAEVDGLLFFRHLVPESPGAGRNASWLEADVNIVRLADVLEPDPSRRPVDLAATAVACARHLAYELRRRHPPCRIVVNAWLARPWIRFHQIRPGQDWTSNDGLQGLDETPLPMLVLESH
ncbi:MAG: hypothetical protein H0T65_01145, partial [Deltaproteobacteria bacterium]|nr:hypothetical protein [Deltaproteobacteria bacterium]